VKGIRLQLQTRAVCVAVAPISAAAPTGRVGGVADGHLTPAVSEVAGGGAIALIAARFYSDEKAKVRA
jgi:hypothetical protein